jgi:hypothetical protein
VRGLNITLCHRSLALSSNLENYADANEEDHNASISLLPFRPSNMIYWLRSGDTHNFDFVEPKVGITERYNHINPGQEAGLLESDDRLCFPVPRI